MAIKYGPNSGLLVFANPGEAHFDALTRLQRWVDFFLNPNVKSAALSAPPGSPVDGDAYIIAGVPTGAWAGRAGQIARWSTDLTTSAWEYHTPKEGNCLVYNKATTQRLTYSGTAWSVFASGGGGGVSQAIPIACSDETTALTVGTGKVVFRLPYGFILTDVRASLGIAQASGAIFTVDVNVNGATVLSTKLTVDNTEKSSFTAAVPPVISTPTLGDDSEITIDIDQVGSGSAKGLKVYLIGTVA